MMSDLNFRPPIDQSKPIPNGNSRAELLRLLIERKMPCTIHENTDPRAVQKILFGIGFKEGVDEFISRRNMVSDAAGGVFGEVGEEGDYIGHEEIRTDDEAEITSEDMWSSQDNAEPLPGDCDAMCVADNEHDCVLCPDNAEALIRNL